MTSTPVKNVSALMNFVGGKGLTSTGATNQAGGFGDIMAKTKNGGNSLGSQSQAIAKSAKTAAKDSAGSRKDIVKSPAETKASAKVDAADKGQADTLNKELVKDIAEELEVSEEEVLRAMEILGLSAYQLLEPANLTQLVLAVSGEADASALLTDEGLFGKLQSILQMAADAKRSLMEELVLSQEEMQSVLEQMKELTAKRDESNGQIADVEAAEENTSKVTVEVKVNGETVQLSADENGNVEKTIGVTGQEKDDAADRAKDDSQQKGGEKGRSESNGQTGNPLIDALLQDKVQVQEAEAPQTMESYFSSQTRDIMDQIMDYMKIQLRPGMDQLELQLHPASLGSVHVQIVSKGGEITAQFQVQNESVRAAIESQVVELKQSLEDQGVKVEAVQVTVESHGFESNLWQGQGREENAASQNEKRTPRRINLNDLDALFEEEAGEEELLNIQMMEMNGNTVDYAV